MVYELTSHGAGVEIVSPSPFHGGASVRATLVYSFLKLVVNFACHYKSRPFQSFRPLLNAGLSLKGMKATKAH